MTAPTKPAAKPRAKATWTVYERIQHANVELVGAELVRVANDVTVLVEIDSSVVQRTAGEACWQIAETTLRDRAQGDYPPTLCASRNGTAHGLSEPRPYALKPTVERVK